jgi:large repetitive protein
MLDAGMATQRLYQATPPLLQTGSLNGFGARAFGNVNLVGGPQLDLVVTHPKMSTVYIYPDGTGTQFSAPPRSILGTGNMGFSLSSGDINGDGRIDIVTGENRTGSSVWLFYNRGTPNTEFDTTAGAGFWQSQLPSSTALGIDVVVGDFNGDGRPDIAAGDHLDGNGKVTVWY